MKKSVIVALCLCLVLSLFAGCGDNSKDNDVKVTVGGNYTFSLTDNISDIIKNLNAHDIRVMDVKYSRL